MINVNLLHDSRCFSVPLARFRSFALDCGLVTTGADCSQKTGGSQTSWRILGVARWLIL